MKRSVYRKLRDTGKRVVAGYCIIAMMPTGYAGAAQERRATVAAPHTATTPEPVVKVNRTVPEVEPPNTTLEFSASPTPQEIFRVRMFAEPLLPLGGDPTPAENA